MLNARSSTHTHARTLGSLAPKSPVERLTHRWVYAGYFTDPEAWKHEAHALGWVSPRLTKTLTRPSPNLPAVAGARRRWKVPVLIID